MSFPYRITKFLAFASLTLSFAATAVAASPEEIARQCNECHGEQGNSSDEKVPSIAGFSAIVLEDALTAFKEQERPADSYKTRSGEKKNMQQIAGKLDETTIQAIAAYYAKQSFKPHTQPADAALARKGARIHRKNCEKCHSEGGANADDDAAILAGQWRGYLERQIELIRSGERSAPRKMRKRFEKLGDSDFKALIEYYASQQ